MSWRASGRISSLRNSTGFRLLDNLRRVEARRKDRAMKNR